VAKTNAVRMKCFTGGLAVFADPAGRFHRFSLTMALVLQTNGGQRKPGCNRKRWIYRSFTWKAERNRLRSHGTGVMLSGYEN